MPRAKKVEEVEVSSEEVQVAQVLEVVTDNTGLPEGAYNIFEVSNNTLFRTYSSREQAEAFISKFPGYEIR